MMLESGIGRLEDSEAGSTGIPGTCACWGHFLAFPP
jgi:hypothetical protein